MFAHLCVYVYSHVTYVHMSMSVYIHINYIQTEQMMIERM